MLTILPSPRPSLIRYCKTTKDPLVRTHHQQSRSPVCVRSRCALVLIHSCRYHQYGVPYHAQTTRTSRKAARARAAVSSNDRPAPRPAPVLVAGAVAPAFPFTRSRSAFKRPLGRRLCSLSVCSPSGSLSRAHIHPSPTRFCLSLSSCIPSPLASSPFSSHFHVQLFLFLLLLLLLLPTFLR